MKSNVGAGLPAPVRGKPARSGKNDDGTGLNHEAVLNYF